MLITAGSYSTFDRIPGGGVLELDILLDPADKEPVSGFTIGVVQADDEVIFSIPFMLPGSEVLWFSFKDLAALEEELHYRFASIRATSINGRNTDDIDYNGVSSPVTS